MLPSSRARCSRTVLRSRTQRRGQRLVSVHAGAGMNVEGQPLKDACHSKSYWHASGGQMGARGVGFACARASIRCARAAATMAVSVGTFHGPGGTGSGSCGGGHGYEGTRTGPPAARLISVEACPAKGGTDVLACMAL